MMNQLQQKEHMYRCIELAKNGIHTCKPNPRVGCVIVKDEKIIGYINEPYSKLGATLLSSKRIFNFYNKKCPVLN